VSYDLVRSVRNLIQQGVGDASRLGYILNRLENGKYLYLSDQKYLEDLLSESDIIASQPLETKVDSHSLGKLESDLKQLNTQLEKILKSRDTVEKTPSDSDFRNIVTPKMTEYKNRKQQAPANEIPQYQQIINSLRAELAEYKNIVAHLKQRPVRMNNSLHYKSEHLTLVLAVVLGLISLQGVGHIYLGKVAKGVGILALSLLLFATWISYVTGAITKDSIPQFVHFYFLPVVAMSYLGLYIFQILDSRKLCDSYNEYISEQGKQPPWW